MLRRRGGAVARTVGGQVIRTTDEHPFWVKGKGWINAKVFQAGDRLVGRNGSETAVEEVYETGVSERVYNFRVAEHHTYYIGSDAWGFDAWAHNACWQITEATARTAATQRGETVIDSHWGNERGFDFLSVSKQGVKFD